MTAIDYQLHGILNIRLLNATKKDQKAFEYQLGIQATSAIDEIDITIEYQNHVSGEEPLRHLVMGQAAYNSSGFFAIESQNGKQYAAKIPMQELGKPCTLICQQGIGEIPLLLFIINLHMIEKGYTPIHASAFLHEGVGVIVNGFPKGGKTSILFSFLAKSAKFVSDDWLYVDKSPSIYGLAQAIKLSDWQLESLPDFRKQIKQSKWLSIKSVQYLDQVEQTVPDALRRGFLPAKAFHRVQRYLNKKQRHIYVSPLDLFDTSPDEFTSQFDVLILTMSHESAEIEVQALETQIAVERLAAALQYEWLEFMEYYIQSCYAFPDKRNSTIESLTQTMGDRLQILLADRPIYAVYHPHPVALEELFAHIQPVIQAHGK
jgi:hypothetical protein